MLSYMQKKIKNWLFWRKNLSAKDKELAYWQRVGVGKGTDIYEQYLKLLEIEKNYLKDFTIADFGCGPLGGIVSIVEGKNVFPIDILADEYNKWKLCKTPIVKFDGTKTTVPESSCDIVFCLNVIDHTTKPNLIVKEIYRIIKPGGVLYVFVHMRSKKELNKAHPVAWDEKMFRKQFTSFEINKMRVLKDPVNDGGYNSILAEVIRK